jgi:hypothetical protein
LEPHLVHPQPLQGDRLGQAQERQGRPPWRSCCGPICSPRPGSRRSRSGICVPCCATRPRWCGGRLD